MKIAKMVGLSFLIVGFFAFGAQTRSASANIPDGDSYNSGGCSPHSVCEAVYHDGGGPMCGYFPFGDTGCDGWYSVDCHEEC